MISDPWEDGKAWVKDYDIVEGYLAAMRIMLVFGYSEESHAEIIKMAEDAYSAKRPWWHFW